LAADQLPQIAVELGDGARSGNARFGGSRHGIKLTAGGVAYCATVHRPQQPRSQVSQLSHNCLERSSSVAGTVGLPALEGITQQAQCRPGFSGPSVRRAGDEACAPSFSSLGFGGRGRRRRLTTVPTQQVTEIAE
jgi:hypothetical protein